MVSRAGEPVVMLRLDAGQREVGNYAADPPARHGQVHRQDHLRTVGHRAPRMEGGGCRSHGPLPRIPDLGKDDIVSGKGSRNLTP